MPLWLCMILVVVTMVLVIGLHSSLYHHGSWCHWFLVLLVAAFWMEPILRFEIFAWHRVLFFFSLSLFPAEIQKFSFLKFEFQSSLNGYFVPVFVGGKSWRDIRFFASVKIPVRIFWVAIFLRITEESIQILHTQPTRAFSVKFIQTNFEKILNFSLVKNYCRNQ